MINAKLKIRNKTCCAAFKDRIPLMMRSCHSNLQCQRTAAVASITDNCCVKSSMFSSYLVASAISLSSFDVCRIFLLKAFSWQQKQVKYKWCFPLSLCFLPRRVFYHFCNRHKVPMPLNRLQLPKLFWVQMYQGTTRAISLWMQVEEVWELDDRSHKS